MTLRRRWALGALLVTSLLGACGGKKALGGPDGTGAGGNDATGGAGVEASAGVEAGTGEVGAVLPEVTMVVAKPARCDATITLVADDDTLYWTDLNLGVVMMVPVAGGAPSKVSDGQTIAPTLLAAKIGTVYWLEGGRRIFRNTLGTIWPVFTSDVPIRGLAVSDDAARVYFSRGESKIESVSAWGESLTTAAIYYPGILPAALAVHRWTLATVLDLVGVVDVVQLAGGGVFCGSSEADPIVGSGCRHTAQGQGSLNLNVVLTTPSKVVWADGPDIKMGALDPQSNASWDHVASASAEVVSMAYSDGAVYFMTFDLQTKLGSVQRVSPQKDATPEMLVRDVRGLGSIAAAGGKVFWTEDCGILSLATPN